MHFKTVRPVQPTEASHLNYVACHTTSWEQAAMFQIELLAKDGVVECYVRNYRLEFNIPYELYGEPRVYEPDFVVRLRNDVIRRPGDQGRAGRRRRREAPSGAPLGSSGEQLEPTWRMGVHRLPGSPNSSAVNSRA